MRVRLLFAAAAVLLASPAIAQDSALGDTLDSAAEATEQVTEDAIEYLDDQAEGAEAQAEVAEAQIEGEVLAPIEQAAENVVAQSDDAVEEAAEEVEAVRPTSRSFEDYANENPPPAGTANAGGGNVDGDWRRLTEAELSAPSRDFPHVEWHGYFRFRADSFWNLDLNTAGTSPILPPTEAMLSPESSLRPGDQLQDGDADLTNPDAEHLAGANIRLRLRPTFHITEKTRIHLELNILDNLMLGSTPDGYNEFDPSNVRADVPLIAFSGGQEPPNTMNALRDSVSVTQAYGEVNTFFGTIRLGRMASQWGLGMVANGGGSYSHLREPRVSSRDLPMAGHGCMDCDYGDYVDRAQFITNLFDTYLALSWDYNVSGETSLDAGDYFGQPRDLGQYDDVRSFTVALFQRPMRPEEIAARNRTLKELRRPAFDWGAYFSYRRQRISGEGFSVEEPTNVYINRDARAFIPDIWFRLVSEPAFRTRIRLEGEIAAIFGSIGNADPRAAADKDRTIQQVGGALEFDYVRGPLATGLNAGFATGRTFDGSNEDSNDYISFGVNDDWTVRDDEPNLTNFKFDRNYFVDAIMFREVIGTITNAVYVNPFFQYDLFAKQDDTLGARLDLIGGFAMNPDATPSGNGFYGIETDLTIYYREPRYGADIMAGVYIPGSAFNGEAGNSRLSSVSRALNLPTVYAENVSADPAWTLQGRFFWAF